MEQIVQEIRVALARQDERLKHLHEQTLNTHDKLDEVSKKVQELDNRARDWKSILSFLFGAGGVITATTFFVTHVWSFLKGL